MPPTSTYRVQLHAGFGFADVAAIAPYLEALGTSHLYASPYLQAAPGSTHGYDVVDPTTVNRELGGEPAHAAMSTTLGEHGLGQILDIVPNHMAITGRENALWWDVLENGPSSRFASFFDVDWDPPESKLRNTVLLPVLGDHYGRVLEAGEIRVEREGGSFLVRYFDHAFPVAPRALDDILGPAAARADSDELAFLASAATRLPPSTWTDRDSVAERHRDKEVIRGRVAELCGNDPAIARAIDATLEELSSDHDRLDAFLERQNYRLAFWRIAGRELDYRRFFNITTLAGLRMEEEHVFRETHRLVLDWLSKGVLDGVRIDHPDGLRDPAAYFRRLREAAPEAWIVVEKILSGFHEDLPASWPVDGTTGYEFLNMVGGLFVDPTGEAPLTEAYRELTGEEADYPTVAYARRHQVMHDELAAEINRLTNLFVQVCESNRRYRDFTRHELHEALKEVIACFPVYRTYVDAASGEVSPADARYVWDAVGDAKHRRPDIDPGLIDFLADVLLLRHRGTHESELVMRFQQATGPIMAKGVEDTAFYAYNRLSALNEVGGDPGQFGISLAEFHRWCGRRQTRWPATMLGTSTHDTKRSEDVRARLALLSEIPGEWAAAARRWMDSNARHKVDGWPDANTEYLLYQTLVGAYPLSTERARAYMEKATREAKTHTSWITPNHEYDEAVQHFVGAVLDDPDFTRDLAAFVASLVGPGRVNGLAQKLVTLAGPGVPDVYQGTELWDLSLVDPDNRRPVDYTLRQRLLGELEGMTVEQVMERADEGLPKLLVVHRTLRLRRHRPELFTTYEPLPVLGARADHLIAFNRGGAVALAPRLVMGLCSDWADTVVQLPEGRWRDVLTGETAASVRAADLLARFPVALLERL